MIVLVEDFKLPHLQLCFAHIADLNLNEKVLVGPELKQYNSLSSQQRKKTYLGVRLIRNLLKIEAAITYFPSGKPFLLNAERHISISHTEAFVALATSEQPIGIDIEEKNRDCMRLINKFVSVHEEILCEELKGNWPLELWCAKEAIYKLYDLPGLSFKDEINIEERKNVGQITFLKGRISRSHELSNFEVQLLQKDHLLIAVAYFIAAL